LESRDRRIRKRRRNHNQHDDHECLAIIRLHERCGSLTETRSQVEIRSSVSALQSGFAQNLVPYRGTMTNKPDACPTRVPDELVEEKTDLFAPH
jgi:hypothetical protein